jgi:hypothetical protein
MASPRIAYRGYLVAPVSHKHQPYWLQGKFVYWGYTVLDASGSMSVSPGATWTVKVGGAKTIIDCLHEAGTHPGLHNIPATEAEREEARRHSAALEAWNERFWALMRDRD